MSARDFNWLLTAYRLRPFGEEGRWRRHAALLAKLHNAHWKQSKAPADFLWRLGEGD